MSHIINRKSFHNECLSQEVDDIFYLLKSYCEYAIALEEQVNELKKDKLNLLKKIS